MGIRHQLLRAGIHEDDIPSDWLPAIIAATEKWLTTTHDGLKYVSHLFGFEIKPAEEDKDYLLVDNVNYNSIPLKTSQVHFFNGCLVDGIPIPLMDPTKTNPLPPYELEISESPKNRCDNCGIFAHCTKDIVEPVNEKTLSLCNYCITFHEHPRVNDYGGWKKCEQCDALKCRNHPQPQRRMV